MTKVLYLRVPDEVHDEITALAASTGASITMVSAAAIAAGLGYRSPADLLDEALERLRATRAPGPRAARGSSAARA